MTRSTYIFAGGGTGGHLYPGLAVAEELVGLQTEAQVVFACSNRAIDRQILSPLPYAMIPQPVAPMPRGLRGWGRFVRAYLASSRLAGDLVRDLQPVAVLGLGGFAAGPVVLRAARLGVRTSLLNPDAVPGKANRLLARKVDAVFTQFEQTAQAFPLAVRSKIRWTGCPIRRGLAEGDPAAAREFFGLRQDRRTLLVFGGSLLAESLSLALEALAGDLSPLAETWQVLHISGSPLAGRIEQALRSAGLEVRTPAYCDRMELAYAAADLVLSRCGAVTVAELMAVGRPAVLMPYPYHKDQHQRLNAQAMERAGAARVVMDAKDPRANARRLAQTMAPLMADPVALEAMRRAARTAGRRDAASAVARFLAGMENGWSVGDAS
jgi:UDP-N-acetylglucosamine--N-acetylmuramyl-(pentapeptide) pyrophosphoryl-undecaprenol N-acetylglucosamine transferase